MGALQGTFKEMMYLIIHRGTLFIIWNHCVFPYGNDSFNDSFYLPKSMQNRCGSSMEIGTPKQEMVTIQQMILTSDKHFFT